MRVPKYRRNPDGRAFIEYKRKRYYLGRYGTPESQDQYRAMVTQIMAEAGTPAELTLSRDPELIELAEPYLDWASKYYSGDDFSPIRVMIEQVLGLYAYTPVSQFGPVKILAWQQWLVGKGYSRTTINKRLAQLKRWLKWLASRELIDASVLVAAQTVEGLRAGKTTASNPEPVRPASMADVEATLPYLPPPVAAMVQIQYLCGMRPQDVIGMRPQDIDQTGDIWLYRPASHKNTHRGQSLVKALPVSAQLVLAPFLVDRDTDAFCFDPRESAEWFARQRRAESSRSTPRYPSEDRRLAKQRAATAAKNAKLPPARYARHSYGQVIARACKKAGVPAWTPLQLRHTIATEISQQLGEQAAQRWLGHARLQTTGIYVEKQVSELIEIARRVDQLRER